MKFEDMANWTEEQIKKEVVRLSEECEKKQHIILDYEALSEKINQKLLENDNWKLPTDEVENVNTGHPSIEWYEQRHQDDCITINQLQTALDVLVDRYANLRKVHGLN
jgi:Zn-dependent M16 (insulinase) family peptidase